MSLNIPFESNSPTYDCNNIFRNCVTITHENKHAMPCHFEILPLLKVFLFVCV